MIPVISFISHQCEAALLAEVSATPKPGLVDRHDSGAHKDMNYHTFVKSTQAIVPYLAQMALTGYEWKEEKGQGLFSAIRPIGIQAEQAMFQATHHVNTHKGMIFSMGLLAAAAGLFYSQKQHFFAEGILTLSGNLCFDVIEEDFRRMSAREPSTHGEILYHTMGMKGIRGEAQEGFPSVRKYALPFLRNLKETGIEDNIAYINTLLALMAHVEDTNVLIRTSATMLAYEKAQARTLLQLGGAQTGAGMEALSKANEDFIARNISPGGCADLLAVTIFLWSLETYGKCPDL